MRSRVTSGELQMLFGLTSAMIRRALMLGLLKPNIHYYSTKDAPTHWYDVEAVKPLVPEIRLLKRRLVGITGRRLKRAREALTNRSVVVDSARKRELLQLIAESQAAEDLLLQQLQEIWNQQATLQRHYFAIRWETRDCPYCAGYMQLPNGSPCCFCQALPVISRTAKSIGPVPTPQIPPGDMVPRPSSE